MKTIETNHSVDSFINAIKDESRRQGCRVLTELMAAATGAEPKMWGTGIVGFGKRHYEYANGKRGEICKVGFAPRSKSFAIYLFEYPEHEYLITKLGKHKYSGGCLHITRLADVQAEILTQMIEKAFCTGDCGAV